VDRSTVEKYTPEYVKNLKVVLGLGHWTICLNYGSLPEDKSAISLPDPLYRSTAILIDPEKVEDLEELQDVVRHELLHAFSAEIVTYRKMMMPFLSDEELDSTDEAYRSVVENTVRRIEHMLDAGLEIPTKKMLTWRDKKKKA
jgi:hypothetical protein